MIKTSLIALATVASISLAALPAYAESVFGIGDQDLAKANVATELRQAGYDVSRVEEWGGVIRAFITLDDGRRVNRFFDPVTLQPVSVGTSVATELSY